PVLVVGDGQEVVTERLVRRDELVRVLDAVGPGRVGVEVAAEPGHQRGPFRAEPEVIGSGGWSGRSSGRRAVPGHRKAQREIPGELAPPGNGRADRRVGRHPTCYAHAPG